MRIERGAIQRQGSRQSAGVGGSVQRQIGAEGSAEIDGQAEAYLLRRGLQPVDERRAEFDESSQRQRADPICAVSLSMVARLRLNRTPPFTLSRPVVESFRYSDAFFRSILPLSAGSLRAPRREAWTVALPRASRLGLTNCRATRFTAPRTLRSAPPAEAEKGMVAADFQIRVAPGQPRGLNLHFLGTHRNHERLRAA